jgi:methylglutaconyl-CoA hydratase
MSENLKTRREDHVLRLTLSRPEKRNALSIGMCRELVSAFSEAEADDGVNVILLDAEGKAFCAGMDLAEILDPEAARQAEVHEQLFTIGARIRKPIVAAVQGPALGGGMALAANAHVILAAEEATFGLTEIRIALWPYVVFRAAKLAVGDRRALELSLTGRIAGAAEAREWGLVNHVLPAAELSARARKVAALIAAFDPGAISQGLEFTHRTRESASEEAGAIAREYRARAFASPAFQTAARAFLR